MEFVLGLIFGILLTLGGTRNSNQDYIDKFQTPVCVEQRIGTERIKKCYEIKEVK